MSAIPDIRPENSSFGPEIPFPGVAFLGGTFARTSSGGDFLFGKGERGLSHGKCVQPHWGVKSSPPGESCTKPIVNNLTGAHFQHCSEEVRAAVGSTFARRFMQDSAGAKPAERPVEDMVPKEFHDFLDVFSKKRSERLPEHREWDLPIELEENAELPKGKLYQMSADELKALKEFVDKNLQKGYIRPSSAPFGAGVFFIKKKDGSLRLVVDYCALNVATKKDAYPLPLTQELPDRLKAAQVFTTLDMRWDYYNVRIQEGDEWRMSFRTHYRQFEFLVM